LRRVYLEELQSSPPFLFGLPVVDVLGNRCLAWYLKLNAKDVHAAIVGAFIDLLVSIRRRGGEQEHAEAEQELEDAPPWGSRTC
jgi:hypothetical protein